MTRAGSPVLEEHEFDLQLATDRDLATLRATLAPGHEPEELLNRWVTCRPSCRRC